MNTRIGCLTAFLPLHDGDDAITGPQDIRRKRSRAIHFIDDLKLVLAGWSTLLRSIEMT
jgi:hypothetical protein